MPPTLVTWYGPSVTPSNASGASTGSSRKKLVNDPYYRQNNLGGNNIYIRSSREQYPEHIASLVNEVRMDRDSPGPSPDQVWRDMGLETLRWALENPMWKITSGARFLPFFLASGLPADVASLVPSFLARGILLPTFLASPPAPIPPIFLAALISLARASPASISPVQVSPSPAPAPTSLVRTSPAPAALVSPILPHPTSAVPISQFRPFLILAMLRIWFVGHCDVRLLRMRTTVHRPIHGFTEKQSIRIAAQRMTW